MKKKKQGASLIVVVIIFMFVSTVSVAMLSMVAGNYKARVAESKRVENLYASDSGLDVAYNVIAKNFDAAAHYGYWKVKKMQSLTKEDSSDDKTSPYNQSYIYIEADIDSLNQKIAELEADKNNSKNDINKINHNISEKRSLIEEDEEMKAILLNEEFKRAFKNFIKETSNKGKAENLPDKLQESIEKYKYISADSINLNNLNEITRLNENIIDFAIQNNEPPTPTLTAVIKDPVNVEVSTDSNEHYPMKDGHSGEVHNLDIYKSIDQEYSLTVTSDFYTEKTAENNEINERQLQANYKMSVPNYKDIFFENGTGDLHKYLALNRALTIGGDMNVGSKTSTYQTKLVVDKGGIFVNGNPDHIFSIGRVYGKYFGGITLDNSSKVQFNSNVVTRGTFNVRGYVGSDEKPALINGNLYARNIYAGTEDGEGYTDEAYLTVDGEAVIDNDLALKATNTHITITDFYGINDKNIYYKDTRGNTIDNGNSNPNDIARTSSSIIVNGYTDSNGNKPSSVEITDEAYIMGTAHIATDGNYQTGESTAVKNDDKANYEAYSVPLDDLVDSNGNSESFIYDDLLHVLNEPNVFTKGEHFKHYWNDVNPNGADNGGIIFDKPNNIHSVGAVVLYGPSKNLVVSANYSNELYDDITTKRISFASEVYKFGQVPKTDPEKEAMLNTYDRLGEDKITVESLMDFSEDFPEDYNSDNNDDYDLEDEIDSDGEKAIFNSDSSKIIVIQGKGYTGLYDDSSKYIVINASETKKVNAVIATEGNVIIDGDVTFNGTIIANGDLTITGDVTINYDKDVIERIQAANIRLFNNVFGGNIIAEENTNSNTEGTDSNGEDEDQVALATKYDLKNFLESKLWRILN